MLYVMIVDEVCKSILSFVENTYKDEKDYTHYSKYFEDKLKLQPDNKYKKKKVDPIKDLISKLSKLKIEDYDDGKSFEHLKTKLESLKGFTQETDRDDITFQQLLLSHKNYFLDVISDINLKDAKRLILLRFSERVSKGAELVKLFLLERESFIVQGGRNKGFESVDILFNDFLKDELKDLDSMHLALRNLKRQNSLTPGKGGSGRLIQVVKGVLSEGFDFITGNQTYITDHAKSGMKTVPHGFSHMLSMQDSLPKFTHLQTIPTDLVTPIPYIYPKLVKCFIELSYILENLRKKNRPSTKQWLIHPIKSLSKEWDNSSFDMEEIILMTDVLHKYIVNMHKHKIRDMMVVWKKQIGLSHELESEARGKVLLFASKNHADIVNAAPTALRDSHKKTCCFFK